MLRGIVGGSKVDPNRGLDDNAIQNPIHTDKNEHIAEILRGSTRLPFPDGSRHDENVPIPTIHNSHIDRVQRHRSTPSPTQYFLDEGRDAEKWHKFDSSNLDWYEFGCLIEIKRIAYHQWALFYKNGRVIQFSPEGGETVGPLNAYSWLDGKVTIDKLKAVAGNDKIRVVKINDWVARDADEIKELIKAWRDSSIFKYCMIYFNCEHFVNLLKFGKTYSKQASRILGYLEDHFDKGT